MDGLFALEYILISKGRINIVVLGVDDYFAIGILNPNWDYCADGQVASFKSMTLLRISLHRYRQRCMRGKNIKSDKCDVVVMAVPIKSSRGEFSNHAYPLAWLSPLIHSIPYLVVLVKGFRLYGRLFRD